MPAEKPRYWGSWKGRVIKAIVLNSAQTWDDIRDFTGLSPKSLRRALAEMYDVGILDKRTDGTYRVHNEVRREYEDFFNRQKISEEPSMSDMNQKSPVKFPKEMQKDLIKWIAQWRDVKRLVFSLECKHFFLEGRDLDGISEELISKHASSEVLVVNPYVDMCNLSNTLRQASKRGINVRLITRPPGAEKESRAQSKQEYHRFLKKDGVNIIYNKNAHAKLIVVDRAVAVVSSMNFYSSSSGGASWEAGLVSIEETVVESIVDSILRLLEKPESKKLI